jgi:uncharacterized protein
MKMTEKTYLKTIKCPICNKETEIPYPRKGTFKISKTDSDFMKYYEGLDLSFYNICYCSECGYAALSSYFDSTTEKQQKLIKEKIGSKWSNDLVKMEYTVDDAIKLHKLALLNAVVKEGMSGEKALLCLRLSWLYRIKGDKKNETRFQESTATSFENAYQTEALPIGGLDKWHLLYLIGELYRRLGNIEKANIYFGQVLSSTEVPYKLREMVRDMRDLIKEAEGKKQ